jgi:hypothetical protein
MDTLEDSIIINVDFGLHTTTRRDFERVLQDSDIKYIDSRSSSTFNNLDPEYVTFAIGLASGITIDVISYAIKKLIDIIPFLKLPKKAKKPDKIDVSIQLNNIEVNVQVPSESTKAEQDKIVERVVAEYHAKTNPSS